MRILTFTWAMLFAHFLAALCHCQEPRAASQFDAQTRREVVTKLADKLEAIYVIPEVAAKMKAALLEQHAAKAFDAIKTGEEFAQALTKSLRDISKDGHLGVNYSKSVIADDRETPPTEDVINAFREAGRRRNYEYSKVEHLSGGVGLLQVNGFYPGEWTKDTVSAAASFLSNCDAIILDLRTNGGGAPTGCTLLCSYFFKEETHLSDQVDRARNTTRQYWTYPVVPGLSLADKDLYILTSKNTFSAPESIAYDLQALKRATIVGETTGGGAHGTAPYKLTDHFAATIPFSRSINPITKTDWEGIGVKPDVAVPAQDALVTAHILALKKILERTPGESKAKADLQELIKKKERELEATKTAPKP